MESVSNQCLKPLVVRLTCSPKDDSSLSAIKGIISRLSSTHSSFGLDCVDVTLADIDKEDIDSQYMSSSSENLNEAKSRCNKFKSFLSRIVGKKSRKDTTKEVGLPDHPVLEGNNKVVILSDYPSNEYELSYLIDPDGSKVLPVLDGVIMFVSDGHMPLKRYS